MTAHCGNRTSSSRLPIMSHQGDAPATSAIAFDSKRRTNNNPYSEVSQTASTRRKAISGKPDQRTDSVAHNSSSQTAGVVAIRNRTSVIRKQGQE